MTEPVFESWYSSSAHQRWAAGLVLGIVLLCVYWPVFSYDYLYYDDWIHFSGREVACSASPMYNWSRINGRPLGQYVLCGLFHAFDKTDQAWRSRVVIVGAIIAFAILQWLYFRAVGIHWLTAICFALGTSVLPGLLVFSYWITAGSLIFALLASTVSALLTQAAFTSEGNLSRKVALSAGACTLQVAALLMYQTEAMYFWTLTAVMLAARLPKDLRGAFHPLAGYVLVGAVAMAGYFVWFTRLSGLASELKRADLSRGTMFTGLSDKPKWFIEQALPRASSLWFFDLPRPFVVAVLAVFTVCLIWLSARLWRRTWRQEDRAGSILYAAYPVVIVALALLSFSPMLVTVYSAHTFRSMVPLSALIFLIGAIHIGLVVRAETWPLSIKLCLAAVFVLGLSCLATGSLLRRMVLPAAAEYSFVRNSLLEAARTGHAANRVHAVVPLVTRELYTDEFNGLSAQAGQDLGPMIQVISRDLGLHLGGPASFSLPGEPIERDGALILDFADLSRSGLWKSIQTEGTSDSHSRLLHVQSGYYVYAIQGLIYGVPVSLGAVRLDGTVASLPGVITGSTVSEVLHRLPKDLPQDSQPHLLRNYGQYNLVAFRGRIYGVPWAAGSLNLADWNNGRVGKLPGVVTGGSLEEVLSRLPQVGEVVHPLPKEAPQDSQPHLLRSYGQYNLVAFRGRIYGVPWAAGPLNLADWNSGRVDKLPGVVTGGSLEEVLSRLPK